MPRLGPYKLALTVAFLVSAVCFLLPFLVISVDERLGRGSGLALARGEPSISGRYVHESYEGEVEAGFDLTERPAVVTLVAVLAGAAGAWFPGRKGFWWGLGSAAMALIGLFWVRQAVSGPTILADVHVRYGYWIAAGATAAAATVAAMSLWRTSWTHVHR